MCEYLIEIDYLPKYVKYVCRHSLLYDEDNVFILFIPLTNYSKLKNFSYSYITMKLKSLRVGINIVATKITKNH